MITEFSISKAAPEEASLDLEVTQEAMEVTVKLGSFRIKSAEYHLAEDFSFKATTRPKPACLIGYLVQEKETGTVSVLVDEIVKGDALMYRFKDTGPFNLLAQLYEVTVPANSKSLDEVQTRVWKIQPL